MGVGAAVTAWLYAMVEGFAATEERPEGISGIIAIDPDGGDWRLVVEREGISGPHLILGGMGLAFTDRVKNPKLWILTHPRDSAPRLVAHLEGYASFVWSAGAGHFIVSLDNSDAREVWRISPDGSDWMPLPLSLGRYDRVHDCSPDGEWLLIGSDPIQIVRPDGTDSHNLFRAREGCLRASWADRGCLRPRFSPDGRRIVYAHATNDGESLWIADVDGIERGMIIPESPVTIVARWSPDGSRLALKLSDCVHNDQGRLTMLRDDSGKLSSRIDLIDSNGGNRRPLELPVGQILLGDWG